jgi:hypothetical protein
VPDDQDVGGRGVEELDRRLRGSRWRGNPFRSDATPPFSGHYVALARGLD